MSTSADTLPAVQSHFADNLERLLGLHRLRAEDVHALLGVSMTTVSNWRNGHKTPGLESAAKLAELFEVNAVDLVYLPFPELLHEIASPERFERVEKKLQRKVPVVLLGGLRTTSVPSDKKVEA